MAPTIAAANARTPVNNRGGVAQSRFDQKLKPPGGRRMVERLQSFDTNPEALIKAFILIKLRPMCRPLPIRKRRMIDIHIAKHSI